MLWGRDLLRLGCAMVLRILAILLLATFAFADVQVREGRMSAEIKSQPLTQVLERLKAQTNMRLVMDDGIAGKNISASFQDLPIALGLKKLLEGTGINYVVLANTDGKPESIFIGGSTKPGAPPRQLDNRPVGNRGVVAPVPPPPPAPISPAPQPAVRQPEQERKPALPPVNVPTGGGFVPEQGKPQQNPDQNQQQKPQELLDDNTAPEDESN
jgi:hypothetical protein